MMRTSLLLLLLLFAHAANAADYRPELSEHAAYFCDDEPKTLKDKPLPDAQIELAFVKTERDLKIVAREFAENNGHRGYSHGTCPGGRRFVLSTPAPTRVLSVGAKDIRIDNTALKVCRRYSIDVIEKGSEIPRSLSPDAKAVSRENLAALALSCIPKDKKDAGPELWALLSLMPAEVPKMKNLPEFLSWLEATRSRLKLPPLKSSPKLDRLAQALGTDSLAHPHAQLMAQKSSLGQEGIQLLGENRAIAEDFTGLALLLWNSPQHRALLLNAKADAIGYALREVPGEKRIVLLLAKI